MDQRGTAKGRLNAVVVVVSGGLETADDVRGVLIVVLVGAALLSVLRALYRGFLRARVGLELKFRRQGWSGKLYDADDGRSFASYRHRVFLDGGG